MRWLAVLFWCGLSVSGCKRNQSIDGLESWRFGQTTAKDGVACSRRDQYTFCSQNGSLKVAGFTGQVNLFFKGHGDDAPLIEIEIEFLRCQPKAILQELVKKLGTQVEQVTPQAVLWPGQKAMILARMPAEDGICLIHFVIPDDKQRLDALRAEAKADPIAK